MATKRMKLLPWGPKVIGATRYEEQREYVARKADKYGYKLIGDRPPIHGAQPDPERIMIGADLSVEKLEEVLGRNPHFVATLLEKEINRPRGARVAALRVIRAAIPPESAQKAGLYKRIDVLLARAKGSTGVVHDPTVVAERKVAAKKRAEVERRRKQQAAELKRRGEDPGDLEDPLPGGEGGDPDEPPPSPGLPDDLDDEEE